MIDYLADVEREIAVGFHLPFLVFESAYLADEPFMLLPASRIVWSRRRCEPPDSAVAAAIEAISRKE